MNRSGSHRLRGRPAFTARQRRIAHIVLSEVDWLHYAELPPDRGRAVPALSPRQRVVMVLLLLEGRSRDEIARLLHISPHTVPGRLRRREPANGLNEFLDRPALLKVRLRPG